MNYNAEMRKFAELYTTKQKRYLNTTGAYNWMSISSGMLYECTGEQGLYNILETVIDSQFTSNEFLAFIRHIEFNEILNG